MAAFALTVTAAAMTTACEYSSDGDLVTAGEGSRPFLLPGGAGGDTPFYEYPAEEETGCDGDTASSGPFAWPAECRSYYFTACSCFGDTSDECAVVKGLFDRAFVDACDRDFTEDIAACREALTKFICNIDRD